MKQIRNLGGLVRITMLASCVAVTTAPARAHHSFAMYDPSLLITVDGTVKAFEWTNPHVLLWVISTATPTSASIEWTIELPTSPGNLTRMGWSKHSLAPGDRVRVQLNPLRDGEHGGSFKKATLLSSGQVLVANPHDTARAAAPAPAGSSSVAHDPSKAVLK